MGINSIMRVTALYDTTPIFTYWLILPPDSYCTSLISLKSYKLTFVYPKRRKDGHCEEDQVV